MSNRSVSFFVLGVLLAACRQQPAPFEEPAIRSAADAPPEVAESILPDVPEGAQAVSLLGEALRAPAEVAQALRDNLEQARADYAADPGDADNIIWLGRRIAYTGDYREAIRVYSEGIAGFPDDARMYRHRGHRYISIREFDRAIEDLERASSLIEGTEDQVEPDGAPNPAGIPVSTLHSNIRYHLGLAYYLSGDLDNALRVFERALAETPNDDMRVATTHWAYMSLRLLGRDEEAAALLEPIRADMNILESMAYHQLCLLYKGEGEIATALAAGITPAGGDSAMYGVGNWHYYNGRVDEARAMFERMIAESGWSSFGRIAAEADLLRRF
jgi:tetratricopeptide (TPR) repeat protein